MGDSGQEKTEQATPKRTNEAQSSGQIAYSKELSGAILFLSGLSALKLVGQPLVDLLRQLCVEMMRLPVNAFETADPSGFLSGIMDNFLSEMRPFFLVGGFSALAAGFVQTRFGLSPKKLKPDLTKLSLIKGVKRLVSLDSLVTVVTSILKIFLVGWVVYYTLADVLPTVGGLANQDVLATTKFLVELLFLLCFRVAAGLMVIGFIDLFYKIWKHKKDLMMSKEDVKEERKQSEGDPKIKQKIKEIQRQKVIDRMMTDVQSADVLIRNPTHFAVALKYDSESGGSPKVVAKGRNLMALSLIAIAEENKVPVVTNKPLARDLYRSVPLGEFIPERLYQAVAEVLAFVYRKKNKIVNPGPASAGQQG